MKKVLAYPENSASMSKEEQNGMINQNDMDTLKEHVQRFITSANTDAEMLERYKAVASLMHLWDQKQEKKRLKKLENSL